MTRERVFQRDGFRCLRCGTTYPLTVTFWIKDKPAKKDEKADPVKTK